MKNLYYFYTQFRKEKRLEGVYSVNGRIVKHLNISNSKSSSLNNWSINESFVECELKDDEDILDGIFERGEIYSEFKQLKKSSILEKVNSKSGVYFSRIYRPIFTDKYFSKTFQYDKYRIEQLENEVWKYRDYLPYNEINFVSGINQLAVLVELLNDIFKTVHPTTSNMSVFGQNIRNLLILCCTEIEAQLKGVLKENSLSTKKNHSTQDYVKLKDILKIDKYELRFSYFPWLNTFNPFKNWDKTSPTKSLPWYDNYNSVKHDRENEFAKGTLENVLDSISALAILMNAQYGENQPYWKEQLGGYFELTKKPRWRYDEHYLPPFSGDTWKSEKALK